MSFKASFHAVCEMLRVLPCLAGSQRLCGAAGAPHVISSASSYLPSLVEGMAAASVTASWHPTRCQSHPLHRPLPTAASPSYTPAQQNSRLLPGRAVERSPPGMSAVSASAATGGTAASAAAAAAAPPQMLHSMAQLPDNYRGVLLDQFGVLHDGEKPYPGAIAAVSQLAARGVQLLIISNSSRSKCGPVCACCHASLQPEIVIRASAWDSQAASISASQAGDSCNYLPSPGPPCLPGRSRGRAAEPGTDGLRPSLLLRGGDQRRGDANPVGGPPRRLVARPGAALPALHLGQPGGHLSGGAGPGGHHRPAAGGQAGRQACFA